MTTFTGCLRSTDKMKLIVATADNKTENDNRNPKVRFGKQYVDCVRY